MGYKSLISNTTSFINNEWVDNPGAEKLSVLDKFNSEILGSLPMASKEQMEDAIVGSVKAFGELSKMSAGDRQAKLYNLIELLKAKASDFAMLICCEAGKPISYAEAEVSRCIATLNMAAEEATRITGEVVPMDFAIGTGKTAITKRFPIGPIAAISPFNFPLNLALHKIAPALAVGCSVVLKPAPQSPLCTLAFAELVKEAGFPVGSVNVVICDIPVAELMVKDERLKMLSFTGSPMIGWKLKEICGKKKVALELGGDAAVIVDENSDLEKAAQTIPVGAYLYAGQICISTQRIYVHKNIYDVFLEKLLINIEKIKVGDPAIAENTVGPIIDKGHLNRVSNWVQDAISKGATLLTGGKIISAENNLYAPTLLTNVDKTMTLGCEEVFGPVAIIEKVESFEQAIEKTNDSKFGLQTGVFTNRIDHMKLAHETLEVGGIIINNIPGFRIDNMPYGGIKDSGLGREGLVYTMEDMTEMRLLVY